MGLNVPLFDWMDIRRLSKKSIVGTEKLKWLHKLKAVFIPYTLMIYSYSLKIIINIY